METTEVEKTKPQHCLVYSSPNGPDGVYITGINESEIENHIKAFFSDSIYVGCTLKHYSYETSVVVPGVNILAGMDDFTPVSTITRWPNMFSQSSFVLFENDGRRLHFIKSSHSMEGLLPDFEESNQDDDSELLVCVRTYLYSLVDTVKP